MCYKYATPTLEEMVEYLKEQPAYTINDYQHYYLANGFNRPYLPITTQEKNGTIELAKWGLLKGKIADDAKAKERAAKTLNARNDKIFETWSYKDNILPHRCLIWSIGFFEHKWDDPNNKKSKKTPHFIYMKDKQPFTFGGLYDYNIDFETGEIIKTFSIITTEANQLMADIHNSQKRMPLVIQPNDRVEWLSDIDRVSVKNMMQTLPDGNLDAYTISKSIINSQPNIPEVQEKFIYPKDTLF